MSYRIQTSYVPLTWQNVIGAGGPGFQEEVISWIMGYSTPIRVSDSKEKIYYRNTLRADSNPGCWYIQRPNGLIILVDFADKNYHWKNMFELLMMKSQKESYMIKTFKEALKVINEKFNLGLGLGSPTVIDYDKIKCVYQDMQTKAEPIHAGNRTQIRFTPYGEMTREAKEYLIENGTKLEDVKNYFSKNIFQVKNAFVSHHEGHLLDKNGNTFKPIGVGKLCFAYYFPDSKNVKLYKPFEDKRYRFLSTCDQNDIFGLQQAIDYIFNYVIEEGINPPKLIITKSWKDMMAIRSNGYMSIAFQNEGSFPDKSILFNKCLDYYKDAYVLFDNDETGYKASDDFVAKYPHVKNIKLVGAKDASEYIGLYGEEKFKEHLQEIL